METRLPIDSLGFFYLGDLYGYVIGLDYLGRFQFRDEMVIMEDVVVVLEESCEHGFVVRDIQGENRFLCRECDERFLRHPDMMEQEMFRPDEAGVYDKLAQFRDGLITFPEATKATGLTLREFKETIARVFPPDQEWQEQYMVGVRQPINRVLINEGLTRTSCPAAIEALFGNPEITLTDIEAVVNSGGVFSDITEVRHYNLPETPNIVIEIEFIDNSTQKVIVDELLLKFEGKKILREFPGRSHIIQPRAFAKLPFQNAILKAKTGGTNGNRT